MFIGACAAHARGGAWWVIVYQLLFLIGFYIVVSRSLFKQYRFAVRDPLDCYHLCIKHLVI